MNGVPFVQGIKTKLDGLVHKVLGKDYIAWATAVQLAGRPHQEVLFPDGNTFMPLFGGGIVAVRQGKQVVYRPILGKNGSPIPVANITSRDVSDSINRCRSKAIAMVNGVGLSLFAGLGGRVAKFVNEVGVKPDTEDLSTVQPMVVKTEGKAPFIRWAAALAAMRLTDPDSYWEVEFSEYPDPDTGEIRKLPVFRSGQGWMVGVTVHWKGMTHTEWAAITGHAMVMTKNGEKRLDHQPLLNPDAPDWNKAVMRCLTKAIALLTGYGINIYAKEDIESLKAEVLQPKSKEQQPQDAQPTAQEAPEQPENPPQAVQETPPQSPISEQVEMVKRQILALKEVPPQERVGRLESARQFVKTTFKDEVALEVLNRAIEEVSKSLGETQMGGDV